MKTTTRTIKRICKSCNGNGLVPPCRKCGQAVTLTPAEESAAVAAFRALPKFIPRATHTISDATGRIMVKSI